MLHSSQGSIHPQLVRYHVVQVPSEGVQAAQQAVADQLANFKQEYGLFEGGLSVRAERVDGAPGGGPSQVLTASAVDRLLGVLAALPHGVVKMSHAVEGCATRTSALGGPRTCLCFV